MLLGMNQLGKAENREELTKELLRLAKSFTSSVVTVLRFACLHNSQKHPSQV